MRSASSQGVGNARRADMGLRRGGAAGVLFLLRSASSLRLCRSNRMIQKPRVAPAPAWVLPEPDAPETVVWHAVLYSCFKKNGTGCKP